MIYHQKKNESEKQRTPVKSKVAAKKTDGNPIKQSVDNKTVEVEHVKDPITIVEDDVRVKKKPHDENRHTSDAIVKSKFKKGRNFKRL